MNKSIQKKAVLSAAFIFLLLLIDQAIKLWVKTSFYLGEDMEILPFFHLLFIENNGMAFGMEVGAKIYLTLFRIIASGALLWYLVRCIRRDRNWMTLTCLILITAGAIGNIIDCVFYGKWFGYADWFNGKVVDMIFCPIFSGTFWEWIPLVGGEPFLFFSPVFNFADSCITIGVFMVLLFQKKVFEE